MSVEREDIAGYAVDKRGVLACVQDVVAWIKQAGPSDPCRWLACMNPHSYVVAMIDVPFSRALTAANWLVPDGIGIVLASKINGGQIRERVTGSDVFRGVMEELNRLGGHSVFFLGASEDTLTNIRARTAVDFPNVGVAGTYSPPFKPEFSDGDNARMIDMINAVAPDVLWVSLTAPKQEKWLHVHCGNLNVKFAAAVGAVFDFYTGRVKRANTTIQNMGIEWAIRLIQEPHRLWRRNFVNGPIFLWKVLKTAIRRKHSQGTKS